MLIGFETKLLYYNDLNYLTWIVIILFQLSYSIGCFFGATTINKKKSGIIKYKQDLDTSRKIKQMILLLSIISALAIIPNLFNLFNKYGSNILASSALIYHDRLTGNRGFELIPYLGSLSHIAVILSSIYVVRYGYKFFLTFPILLLILNILPTGGRMDFFYGILYFTIPVLLYKNKIKNVFKFRHKFVIFLVVSVLIFVIGTISKVRTIDKTPPSYMSTAMGNLFEISPVIASFYAYTTAPVGVLNKYLEDPKVNFGSNTFGFFYSTLNKLGFNIEYERYQEFVPIPMYINVGTYIREVIQDFSYVSILLVSFFGVFFGRLFKIFNTQDTTLVTYSIVLLFVTIFMSFYMFSFREPVFWIITISGFFVCTYIDSPLIFKMKK